MSVSTLHKGDDDDDDDNNNNNNLRLEKLRISFMFCSADVALLYIVFLDKADFVKYLKLFKTASVP